MAHNKEIGTLTGLRGVAAAIVMLFHFVNVDPYFQRFLPNLVKRGYLGVDLFFVLSGFVMALTYGELFKHKFCAVDFKTFMMKRVARVYPLYLVITIVFALKYLYNFSDDTIYRQYHVVDFIGCLLLLQAWGLGLFFPAGATWSLSAEFLAYLLFPILTHAALGRWPSALALFTASIASIAFVAHSNLGIAGTLDVVSY